MLNTQIKGGSMMVGNDTLVLAEDFGVPGFGCDHVKESAVDVCGYGIQEGNRWNDYKKFKGEGVVMFFDGEPTDAEGNPKSQRRGHCHEWAESLGKKRELAQTLGAKAVVVIMEDDAFEGAVEPHEALDASQSRPSLNREKEGKAPTSHPFVSNIQGGCVVGQESKVGSLWRISVQVRNGKPAKAVQLESRLN